MHGPSPIYATLVARIASSRYVSTLKYSSIDLINNDLITGYCMFNKKMQSVTLNNTKYKKERFSDPIYLIPNIPNIPSYF